MKAQIGDLVKITENESYHHFKIGEIVKITEVMEDKVGYIAHSTKDMFEFWCIGDDDFELIESKHD